MAGHHKVMATNLDLLAAGTVEAAEQGATSAISTAAPVVEGDTVAVGMEEAGHHHQAEVTTIAIRNECDIRRRFWFFSPMPRSSITTGQQSTTNHRILRICVQMPRNLGKRGSSMY